MTVWAPGEVRRFLNHVRAADETLYPLFALVVSTGMRRGEALGLSWNAVDLEGGVVRITKTLITVDGKVRVGEPKTKRSRRAVSLDAQTASILRRHKALQSTRRLALGDAWNDTAAVFDDGTGSVLRPDRVSKTFSKLAAAAGVPRIRFHDLRHTAASLMLAAGVPAKVASERLGHATISITLDTYSHLLPGLSEDAAERTGALIYGPAGESG
jgi:integrase